MFIMQTDIHITFTVTYNGRQCINQPLLTEHNHAVALHGSHMFYYYVLLHLCTNVHLHFCTAK